MKLKILHLLSTNKYSGAENVACNIINILKSKYEFYYCSPKGDIEEVLKNNSIKHVPIKKLSLLEIKKVLKEIQPDIIHAHDNKATVLASFFSKNYKIVSHIHSNSTLMRTCNLKTLLFNFCSKRVDKFIWVSDSAYQQYYFKKNIKEKSIILYNIIDEQDVEKKSNLYNINKEYDLIFLGRLEYPKNIFHLIDIVKLIREKKQNISLAVVGDGVDRIKAEELVKNYKLENNITFYGFQKNPYPILKKSKILVMTSVHEGMPMCTLEAQSLGKPIVSTMVGGLKKIVIPGKNGFLSNNDEEYADFIVDVLNNKNKLNELSLNSVNLFKEYNNKQKYIDTLESIYETEDK